MKWTAADGSTSIVHTVNDFKGAGVAIGMYNTDDSIRYVSLASFIYFESITKFVSAVLGILLILQCNFLFSVDILSILAQRIQS